MNKVFSIIMLFVCTTCFASCSDDDDNNGSVEMPKPESNVALSVRNLERAIALTDTAVAHYFNGSGMTMARYYNPYTGSVSSETGSVWMYTSAIEAVNSVLESLQEMKALVPNLYAENYTRYEELLERLTDCVEYYAGSFTLTSYTQTKEWTVYAVNRSNGKGEANVQKELNVYDDQEWLAGEFIRAWRITGKKEYLEKGEYLMNYVLDGWDCTLDANGNENGGITWGPGYVTKHSCSNGPAILPLIWLYEAYRGKGENITYKRIAQDNSRYAITADKSAYYLEMAQKIYKWQKRVLMMPEGVFYDMLGGTGSPDPQYEYVNGEKFRMHTPSASPVGKAYTYNVGSMLTGAAELYRVTRIDDYRADMEDMTANSFSYFATKAEGKEGCYTYPIDGFSTWFNCVLMRGYLHAASHTGSANVPLLSYQSNLDYGYANFLYKGMLPTNLLVGWSWSKGNNNTEGMFEFAFATEYAMLANYVRTITEE